MSANFTQYIEQALDDIDCALFSSDVFVGEDEVEELRGYLEKWLRKCEEIENKINGE